MTEKLEKERGEPETKPKGKFLVREITELTLWS